MTLNRASSRMAVPVMALIIAIFAVLAWSSHGLDGWVIFAAPMLPLVASLLLDQRGVRMVVVIVGAIVLFLLASHLGGQLSADKYASEQYRYTMRAMLMLLSLVGVNWVIAYHRLSSGQELDGLSGNDQTRDMLTGLLNRAVIDQALVRESARARRAEAWVSLALVEIDEYDSLLARHGTGGAENCLLGVADGLRYCLRRSSDALGRFSSRQLCILMSDTNEPGATKVGEKFRLLIETLDIPLTNKRTILLTVSVGVATCKGRDLAGAEELISVAEQALQEAQLDGGNCTRTHTLEPKEPGLEGSTVA